MAATQRAHRFGRMTPGLLSVLAACAVAGVAFAGSANVESGEGPVFVTGASPSKTYNPQASERLWTYPDAPSGTVYFPHDGVRVEPAGSSPTADGTVSTAEQALAFLGRYTPTPSDSQVSGAGPTIVLGYFTNDTSGDRAPNGELKLVDVHELGWLFMWPLKDRIVADGPAGPGRPSSAPYEPGQCIWWGFVTTTGMIPIAGQDCSRDAAAPAVAVVP